MVGNWKMHGRLAENAALLQAVASARVNCRLSVRVVCACRRPYLAQAQSLLDGTGGDVGRAGRSAYHARRVHRRSLGANGDGFCRDVCHRGALRSAARIVAKALSRCRSEDRIVRSKPALRSDRGCVGETLEEREAGATRAGGRRAARSDMLLDRVGGGVREDGASKISCRIRAGLGDRHWQERGRPGRRQQVHAFLRGRLAVEGRRSCEACRCCTAAASSRTTPRKLFRQPDIDGGLIGGASLKVEGFSGDLPGGAERVQLTPAG